jgi:hypothetical protein
VESGSRLLGEKGCTSCHVAGKAPVLSRGLYASGTQVFAAMWNHAAIPGIENREWPSLTGGDIANLVSYLTSPR